MQFSNVRVLLLSALAAIAVARPLSSTDSVQNLQKRGVFSPLCIAACTPLLINPIAYAACVSGCAATADDNGDVVGQPVLQDDGSVSFLRGTPTFHADGSVTVDNSSPCDVAAASDDSGSDDSSSEDTGSDDTSSDDLEKKAKHSG